MTYFSLNKCVCFCLMSIHACMSVYSKEMDSRHKGDLMELNCKLKLKRNEKKKKKSKFMNTRRLIVLYLRQTLNFVSLLFGVLFDSFCGGQKFCPLYS